VQEGENKLATSAGLLFTASSAARHAYSAVASSVQGVEEVAGRVISSGAGSVGADASAVAAAGAPLMASGVLGVGEMAVGAYQYRHTNKAEGNLNMIAGGFGVLAALGAATGQVEIALPAAILSSVAVGLNLRNQIAHKRR